MENIIRYLIKVNKYVSTEDGKLSFIGFEMVETDSSTIVSFPTNRFFDHDTKLNITLEFVEKREYADAGQGMIKRNLTQS